MNTCWSNWSSSHAFSSSWQLRCSGQCLLLQAFALLVPTYAAAHLSDNPLLP